MDEECAAADDPDLGSRHTMEGVRAFDHVGPPKIHHLNTRAPPMGCYLLALVAPKRGDSGCP